MKTREERTHFVCSLSNVSSWDGTRIASHVWTNSSSRLECVPWESTVSCFMTALIPFGVSHDVTEMTESFPWNSTPGQESLETHSLI
jgi:hypothetical protein